MQDLPPLNPDGVTISPPSPQQGIRRADTGQSLPGQGNGESPSNSNSGGEISGVPGIVGGAVSMGISNSPLGQVPGVNAGVGAAIQGGSLDTIQDAIIGSVLGWSASTAVSNAGLGYGLPGIAGSVASEFSKDNPNYGAAALGSAVQAGSAMLGGLVGGPFGAMLGGTVGGNLANSSLKEGYLGDFAESRSRESERDAVEDAFGYSVSETEAAARVDTVEGYLNDLSSRMSGITGTPGRTTGMDFGTFGLADAFDARTTNSVNTGLLDKEARASFGYTDLTGYLSSIDTFDEEIDAMAGISAPTDTRSDWGKSLNDASLLGDRDLTAQQNMDRQPNNETPGGLFGGNEDSSGGFNGVGADNDAGLGGRGGDASNDPN